MKWFPVTLLAVAGMIFTACENSDSINYNVVTINMLNEENGKTLINIKKTVYHDSDEITAEANLSIAKDNNFILSAPNRDSYNAKNKNNCFFFCDAGKKGINSVKKSSHRRLDADTKNSSIIRALLYYKMGIYKCLLERAQQRENISFILEIICKRIYKKCFRGNNWSRSTILRVGA